MKVKALASVWYRKSTPLRLKSIVGLRNYDLDRDDEDVDLNNIFGVLTVLG